MPPLSPKDGHVPQLDLWRAMAIMFVFVFHCLGAAYGQDQLPWNGMIRDFSASPFPSFLWLYPATYGWTGVAVFFVISGFCIHFAALRRSSFSIGSFYLRRWFRIYPPYLLALVFFSATVAHLDLRSPSNLSQFLSHLFLVHNFSSLHFFGVNPAFWSIAVEAQLYLLYPVLMAFASRFGLLKVVCILGVAEVGGRIAVAVLPMFRPDAALPFWLSGSPFYYWFEWALGALVAERYCREEQVFAGWRAGPWIGLFVACSLVRPLESLCFPTAALCAAILIDRSLATRSQRVGLSTSFLTAVGLCSYSLYLWHQPLVRAFADVARQSLSIDSALVLFLVCLASFVPLWLLSTLLYKTIEVRSVEFGKRLMR